MKVEKPLTADEEEMLDRMARFIVRRRLSAPMAFFLRTVTPLSYVGSQAMWVLQPLSELFFSEKQFLTAQKLLERREGIDMLLDRIEEIEEGNGRTENQQPQEGHENE